ncbi:MAG: HelD family protein, partial [Cellulosilyticaceae bacterium]
MKQCEDQILEQEKAYLEKVVDFLKEEIKAGLGLVAKQKNTLVDIRKEMWEEGMSSIDDFDRAIDISQYVNLEAIETSQYKHKLEQLVKHQKMIEAPYFGRFDFVEDGEDEEKIYVGYHNLMNQDTYEVMVYDWRTPIAGLFYNHELGRGSYEAPCGVIEGELTLKRQYEINHRKLDYYFDSSIAITDDILQQALGQNASYKMQNIVETIQQEQNKIIRDKESDVLIVQGVAGSGKTSIALHRIAFLLYNDMGDGLSHKDVMIISPNSLFGDYISGVLPELGEKNVTCITLEDVFSKCFGSGLRMGSRHAQLESIISSPHRQKIREGMTFKGSHEFVTILERYMEWLEHEGIHFKDVYYDNELIMSKKAIKAQFLDNAIGMPIAKRLSRIEKILLDKIKPLEKIRLKEIEKRIEDEEGYMSDSRGEAKRLLHEYRGQFISEISRFTKVNYVRLYQQLMKKPQLFDRLAKGLEVPSTLEGMLRHTARRLEQRQIAYEDGAVLLYLKLRIEGENVFPQTKQVLVDEAQDYYPIHYRIFKLLFRQGQYTILGDYCQTIEKEAAATLYDEMLSILEPKKAMQIALTKSYRSTYEINTFTQKLRGLENVVIPFERHG